MFFLPRHKFRRRMGLGQDLTDLQAQKDNNEQEQDEGYYPQEPQEPPEVQAMKEKLKRMTAYHADDYDHAESDLHSELVLATTKFIHPGGGWWKPWLVSIAFSTLYALVAGFLGSYFSPQAGGSGISDIRAYLNGIHIRNLLSIRTLIAKSFGVSFSIASGLVAGKEGPYIHIGAILAGGLANMGSESVIR
ncbi:chloride channel [Dunaliella salina]|uniref:Chloride channel n=1 Tax=Dunaliella salina TaxID=3046 RepID=A0ABQ7GDU5_DUNSA|nr:chloride channel [Dunaliella salina]|eukprot:KAF5832785.1 chloride channel [Dunaliella salina]